jgi:uncharacterized membrane protein
MSKSGLIDAASVPGQPSTVRSVPSVGLIALSLVIVAGFLLRWVNLGHSVYWGDEVYSSIRIFGHRTAELRAVIAQGQVVTAATIQTFQQLSPLKGIGATLQSLAIEDAHLTPLYFVLVRLWAGIFGDSVAAIRSFSALCGCLLLPVTYGLAIELFQRRRVAMVATALVAVSPIQLIYAQEARMYSLWTLTVAVAALLLLRALRYQRPRDWWQLTGALTLMLYSHFLSVMMLGGFSVYVLLTQWRQRHILWAFARSGMVALLVLGPWLWIFLHRRIVDNNDQEAFSGAANAVLMLKNWFSNFRRGMIDFNTSLQDSPLQALLLLGFSVICLGIFGWAIAALWRSRDRSAALFVIMLMITLPLALFGDSLAGLLPPRWILPSYLGLQLLFAAFLGGPAARRRGAPWRPPWQLKPALLSLLLVVGLASCLMLVRSESWWHRGMSECNPRAARLIDQSAQPLVVSDGVGGEFFDHALSNVISLSRLVKPQTVFQVVLEPQTPTIAPQKFSDIWVLTPSQHLRDWFNDRYPGQLQPQFSFHQLYRPYRGSEVCLWRLTPAMGQGGDDRRSVKDHR